MSKQAFNPQGRAIQARSNAKMREDWKVAGMSCAERRAQEKQLRRELKDPWQPFERCTPTTFMTMRGCSAAYKNNVFVVQVYPHQTAWGEVLNLMVRRNDGAPVRAWDDLQRVKNELCGRERVAVEVYPAESDLVDQANLYHLWVLPPEMKLPFGLHLWREQIKVAPNALTLAGGAL